ncbi:MAG: transcription termination/antitermination protein NusA [Armatimonadetes bacterium]|nr:MAG: transcription termination/antitermination protein NusA [Armatimonadota bacterium]
MDYNLMDALDLLEREKGVPRDTILEALANALVSAYKRTPGAAEEARVTIDADTGEISVYGQVLDEEGNVVEEWEDTPDDFGRIAAQTAKQVILQRLRDAKREQVFDLYEGREGDLITGIVQQSDHRFAILDLGDAEAMLPGSEKIPFERLERGNRVKALVLEVRGEGKGAPIVVTRSHPEFIRALFELEVPELVDGDIEIKVIAREAGHRTKIAVASNDPNVDPVGACVGARGSRVRQVVNELKGEKVDIVEWDENVTAFIAEALSPARVLDVRLVEPEEPLEEGQIPTAIVIVPDHQLSLAIGKEGQNARLAARLSGYKIDIQSESQDLGLDVQGDEDVEFETVTEGDGDQTSDEGDQTSDEGDQTSDVGSQTSDEEADLGSEVRSQKSEASEEVAEELVEEVVDEVVEETVEESSSEGAE